MSSSPAPPLDHRDARSERASMALHGLALNALFPPPPRLPEDMLVALAQIDRPRR